MKQCTKCKLEKTSNKFGRVTQNKDGLAYWCKSCKKSYDKKYYSSNSIKIKQRSTNVYWKDPVSARAAAKEWATANPERKKARDAAYYEANREEIISYVCLRAKSNRPQINQQLRERANIDLNFKLRTRLRGRLHGAIKNGQKAGSAISDLGCTIQELQKHLESKFYPNPETGEDMEWSKWSKYGWNIDHIRPLKAFDLTDRIQFLQACHYTNLQPLWFKDNAKKGAK